ncbi:MAG: glucose 1-dehydrogenase, partial [Alphaproteobacteria bacterium]|nr:glucose 1-dehydrogenase [Alphaproteobacteria bacterium]
MYSVERECVSTAKGENEHAACRQVTVITGSGSGFGEGIAKACAREGAWVVVSDINEEGGRRVTDEISTAGGSAVFFKADVSDSGDTKALIDYAQSHFGRFDVLVNNAGVGHLRKPLTEVTEDEFDRVFAVNVKGIFHTAKAAVPMMREQGSGVIINIASTGAVSPRPGLTWYNASKGAVTTLTKSMAIELAPDRIRVNALNPVAGDTPLLPTFLGEDTPETREAFRASV